MIDRPPRHELRYSVLARLASFTEEIEWSGENANHAFADSVIEFADWLAGTTPPPPPMRGPGASRDAIDQALTAAADAVADAKYRRTRGEK